MAARGRNANGRPSEVIGQTPMFGEVEDRITDNVWTPEWVFTELGLTFDLDVASPVGGVPWIPTAHYYTIHDDGLSQPWYGRVWMNPPFSKCNAWVHRFIEHGNGIAMLPMSRAPWGDIVWNHADAIVRMPSRFLYVRETKSYGIFMPSFMVAMGADNAAALGRIGRAR